MVLAVNHEDLPRDYRKAAKLAGYVEESGADTRCSLYSRVSFFYFGI